MNNTKTVQLNGRQYTIFLDKKIQESTSGDVFYAVCLQSKQQFACKLIPKSKGISNSMISNSYVGQALMLKNLTPHANILAIKQVIETGNNIYVFEELCEETLGQLMKKKQFTQAQAIAMITQIACGYLFLLQEGVVHKGLCPANILVRKKVLKIRNFDKLRNMKVQIHKEPVDIRNTWYLPVETAKYGYSTSKQDVWSIGMIFYQILFKKLPYSSKGFNEFFQKMEKIPIVIEKTHASPSTVDFLEKALIPNQKARLSWEQFFKHPVFKGFFSKQGNKQFYEDRLKMIMSRLRTIIQVNNFSIQRILQSMGFNSPKKEISFKSYFQFLQRIQPSITQTQADYIFKKTDADNSKSISITQIQAMFKTYGVIFNPQVKGVSDIFAQTNQIKSTKNIQENPTKSKIPSLAVQQKIQNLFTKLFNVVQGSHQQFERLYSQFASSKQKIDIKAFTKLMNNFDKSILAEQVQAVFGIIDQDNSSLIDYVQFQNFFYKVNGLPPRIRILSPTKGKGNLIQSQIKLKN